jgi:hypothetical protein
MEFILKEEYLSFSPLVSGATMVRSMLFVPYRQISDSGLPDHSINSRPDGGLPIMT